MHGPSILLNGADFNLIWKEFLAAGQILRQFNLV
jgi:hypothetical protein